MELMTQAKNLKTEQFTFEQNRSAGKHPGWLIKLLWGLLLASGLYMFMHITAAQTWIVTAILIVIGLLLVVPAAVGLSYRVFVTLERNPHRLLLEQCLLNQRYVIRRIQFKFEDACQVTQTDGYFSKIGHVYTIFVSGRSDGNQVSQAVNSFISVEEAKSFANALNSFIHSTRNS